ncbi:hypothetical protein [Lysinibacillus pakistanensis]|uniref:Uncharacterized protein n=1 Tax=Lysinibacillus pakistanensis TaxID=759811 RepID=A0AAX3WS59_9BACI|nr:hypothetical protein [Lysinibacillus pakistanensis]MDM5230069.1 hypothetical protein [Lysinibacillus pakistanensis]QGG52876.1 hypothetical protein GDS87_19090 [Lysinibacillus pakistanensis]WHY45667.1 hypothetical protein QNH22_20685 [Lysinibacillus pakistanensis]WHY50675.1 hypothetical protein QNH24_20650 [Lysinibacillus pakistanensis]
MNYTKPTIIEFGNAENVIKGCAGWGTESLVFNSSDSQYRWIYSGGGKLCICTSLDGTKCKPQL